MDLFEGTFPLRVDLAYAQAAPKSFCGAIYHKKARLWLHEDMARLVLLASKNAQDRHRLRVVLYDGLRTTTAQELMRATPIVKANPQWLEGETRLLSPPGKGAHPRGMAIDLTLETAAGQLLDMGTPFDELSPKGSAPAFNRAHRQYEGKLPKDAKENRKILEECMIAAALRLGFSIVALPQEWWDFRFPPSIYDQYAPLSDDDLPPQMRMTKAGKNARTPADLPAKHFRDMQARLPASLPV